MGVLWLVGWLLDLRPMSGVPSVGIFLKDPSPYLYEFRKKSRKTPKGWVDKRDRGMNLAPPVHQFFLVLPLVLLRTDSLTSMPYPGFEPGTFGVAAGFSNHWGVLWKGENFQ